MFRSTGILRYHNEPVLKLVVDVDQAISDYYRSLLPPYKKANPQRYGAHISVVRKEIPPNMQFWGKYEGEEVEFFYAPGVQFGKVYCWLNVWCNRLEEIRIELGLPVTSEYTLPPEGFVKCFHSTIGNYKE